LDAGEKSDADFFYIFEFFARHAVVSGITMGEYFEVEA
jgi:hypothetical protein